MNYNYLEMMKYRLFISIVFVVLFSCSKDNNETPVPLPEEVLLAPKSIAQEIILTDRGIIWGFDFLPDNKIIFTEKTGKIGVFSNGTVTELTGLPNNINAEQQGGLLDICVHPNYATNGWIYSCYSSKTGTNGVVNLIRFKINGSAITNIEKIFSSTANNSWLGHYGSRIVFDKNNFLFLSIGEGGVASYGGPNTQNLNAQNVNEPWGKILRMTDTGGIPADNPILSGNTQPNLVYSYGHRNPQGLVLNTTTGDLYETEHGPKGGDEFNMIKKALNYGWPLVSYGINYDGTTISANPLMNGIEPPLYQWTPSIGACGLAYVSTNKYGNWKGNFLAGGLALKNVTKLKLNANNSVTPEIIFDNIGRVRNVKESKEGFLYLSVEAPGRIIKLIPSF
jgi:aldose sugar dehydrogenase